MKYAWRLNPHLIGLSTILALSATLAIYLGYLSPDSWVYLTLAQSLVNQQGCLVDGHYYAIFPCGYPALLALTAYSSSLISLMVSSKIANAFLLLLSFTFIRSLFKSPISALLVVIAPSTLLISQHTWSENLFLFSLCLALSQIESIKNNFNIVNFFVLVIALLIGVSSRYFFAPYAFMIWFCVFWSYGKRVAFSTFPAFFLAGLFFAAYYLLNQQLTGFGTGTPRIPAPESIFYLTVAFLKATSSILLRTLPVIFFLIILSPKENSSDSEQTRNTPLSPSTKLIISCGITFLVLSFLLRAHTQYDLYGTRTLGYGVTLLLAGLLDSLLPCKWHRSPTFYSILVAGSLSLYTAQISTFKLLFQSIIHRKPIQSSIALMEGYQAPASLRGAESIVIFEIPRVSPLIAAYPGLYFKNSPSLIAPLSAPYSVAEKKAQFLERISRFSRKNCLVDFTQYSSPEDFRKIIYDTYPVGIKLAPAPRYDPELADFLMAHFQSGQAVDCKLLIPDPPSRT